MVEQGAEAPAVPAAPVLGEELAGDGDVLGGAGRSAGEGEHENALGRAKKSCGLAVSEAVNVGREGVVAGDGEGAGEIFGGADTVEAESASEIAGGVAAQLFGQDALLRAAGNPSVVEEALKGSACVSFGRDKEEAVEPGQARHGLLGDVLAALGADTNRTRPAACAVSNRGQGGESLAGFGGGGIAPVGEDATLEDVFRIGEAGQEAVEELHGAAGVLGGFDVDGLVVFGARDDPEIARLRGLGVECSGLFDGDVAVAFAVNEEHGAREHATDGLADGGEAAAELALGFADHAPAEEHPEFGGVIFVYEFDGGKDVGPALHEVFEGGVGGEDAVGDEALDVRVLGGDEEAGAGATRDAEHADFGWAIILPEPVADEGDRAANVVELAIARPLARGVADFFSRLAMAAEIEGEDVVAGADQGKAIAGAAVSIALELGSEENETFSFDFGRRVEEQATEADAVGGPEVDFVAAEARVPDLTHGERGFGVGKDVETYSDVLSQDEVWDDEQGGDCGDDAAKGPVSGDVMQKFGEVGHSCGRSIHRNVEGILAPTGLQAKWKPGLRVLGGGGAAIQARATLSRQSGSGVTRGRLPHPSDEHFGAGRL